MRIKSGKVVGFELRRRGLFGKELSMVLDFVGWCDLGCAGAARGNRRRAGGFVVVSGLAGQYEGGIEEGLLSIVQIEFVVFIFSLDFKVIWECGTSGIAD